jgi:hypothetical protein
VKTNADFARAHFEALLCACCGDLRELAMHAGANAYDMRAIAEAHEVLASRIVGERPPLTPELYELL